MARRPQARGSTDRRSTVRCAIYTRKSTEEGLEQEFNSLDAQHEACAAYILSQRHEGWVQVKDRYDDGGFSGGTMERPGLKRLLADIAVGRVDVIVVYKVDRLTRALSDFAKIVDVLDARGASFVSVTQAFNTTTSMGRLTLNVLLSFAQFEREVTGERIRDKVAASKKKGMWMGGPVPLGYRVQDRKLIVEDGEAAVVQHIFERYRALGTGRSVIDELRAGGYRSKERLVAGEARGGVPFTRGMLFHILGNAIYRGKIVHQGTPYEGEHEAIVASELWDDVQRLIETNRVAGQPRGRGQHLSVLAGLIRDGLGRRMTPSHAVKGSKRYRYYITHDADLRDGGPKAWRLPARDVERAVVWKVQQFLRDRRALLDALMMQGVPPLDTIRAASALADLLDSSDGSRTAVPALVRRVEIGEASIRIAINGAGLRAQLGAPIIPHPDDIWIDAPAIKLRQRYGQKLVIADGTGMAVEPDPRLVQLLREARTARRLVETNPQMTIKDIAARQRQCRQRLAKLIRLSWLAPDIVTAIVEGRHPPRLTPKLLLDANLPVAWSAQRERLGLA